MSSPRSLATLTLLLAAACSASDRVSPRPDGSIESRSSASEALPAKKYSLVLGNSISYGFQPGKDVFDPSSFNTGIGTLLVAHINAERKVPHATEVNLACPGETTESFVHGGCVWTGFGLPLHVSYQGAQLSAAEDFLRQHPGQVNPIVFSLGANDLYIPYLFDCGGDEACVVARIPTAAATLTANYDLILDRLRALAPKTTLLILVEYEFPILPASINRGLAVLYQRVRAAGLAHGAVVVDANPIIQADPCGLSFACAPEPDVHPTDAGYRALGDALWEASALSR